VCVWRGVAAGAVGKADYMGGGKAEWKRGWRVEGGNYKGGIRGHDRGV